MNSQRNTNVLFICRKASLQTQPAGDPIPRIMQDGAVIPKAGTSTQDDFRGYPDK